MKKLAVIGYPLDYTLSPDIHNKWIKKYKINAQYSKLKFNEKEFKDFFISGEYKNYYGLNVTMPYKEKVLDFTEKFSDEIQLVSSCNTLIINKGVIEAFNTDYFALKNILKKYKFKNSVVIGSGAFAKMSVALLNELQTEEVFVYSRSKPSWNNNNYRYIDNINDIAFDIKIIAIPRCNLYYNVINKITSNITVDVTYSYDDKENNNSNYISGKFFLIEQAKYSFEKWFNIFPSD